MSNTDDTKKLLRIKDKISEAKSEQSEIKGKTDTIENQIKSKFKIETSEIDSELDTMADKLDKKEQEKEKKLKVLEDSYDWDQ